MCGITGFVTFKPFPFRKKIIRQMLQQIKHRGPDDEGIFTQDNVTLGVRRLSIIDVKGGKQPIHDEKKKVTVVFNGEIYNYKLLRKELKLKGHVFKTETDTEVIVHMYEEKKEELFKYLNGMFAIAIWDEEDKKLVLGRDRIGEKPLYWGIFNNDLIFASELKAILVHPRARRELNLDSVYRYLTYEYVPAPYSIFKNIYKLMPGHYLIFKRGRVLIEKYWDVSFQRMGIFSEEEVLQKLEVLIEDSVKLRLVSDVPLGVFLSGGLDSSTIAYYASKNSRKKLKSFSIGFEQKSFDESKYAELVAKKFGLIHHHKIFTPKDLIGLIPEVVSKMDEPLADSSLFPTYFLSKFSREKVTVSLGGDGADELFMGYPTFQAHRLADFYNKVPQFFHNYIISHAVRSLNVSFENFSFDFKAKKFIEGIYENPLIRNQIWLGAFGYQDSAKKILLPDVRKSLTIDNPIEEINNKNDLKRFSAWDALIYQYIKTYLADDILVKVDRASMLNSLEVRSPFLDYRIVEFVCALPVSYKLRGFTNKYILKKLMSDKLPSVTTKRSKKGFGIPISLFLRNELKEIMIIAKNELGKQNIFDNRYINNLVDMHLEGRKDNRKQIWTLIIFYLWYRTYFS